MEGDLRERTQDIVAMILNAAGYEVESADELFDLSAVGNDDSYVVLISDNPAECERFCHRTFKMRIGEETEECRKILVTFDGAPVAEHCTCWGEEEIVRYAGEAALARIFGRRVVLDEAAPVRSRGQTRSAIRHLPIKVSERDASILSGTRGKARCRFVPYWCCHCTSTGSQSVMNRVVSFEGERNDGINAINGTRMEMMLGDAVDTMMPDDCEVLTPKIPRDEVEETTVAAMIKDLTQRVRIKKEEGDAVFYQEETLKPKKENITAEVALVYVPVWQVEGRDRVVEVNAFTGEVMSVPSDEGVEIF
ncbi:hypothetical protein E2N92_09340 [Methanofollis formosanus]|uniref:Uncharacterized protein n=1 Tax=Methanofollis formosanus TaxID=299308 RepID=A0A8G1EGA0_9EURY|nr:hypothetical protein [Methanofollis formosanus]QYZ79618.1 hypothetical protein E2N92_09340 [Methanofollis formosanus]